MHTKASRGAQPNEFARIHVARCDGSLVILVVLVFGVHAQRDILFSMKRNPYGRDVGNPDAQCSSCAWHFVGGRGRPVDRCRRHGNQRVDTDWPGCESHVETLDCLTCGACCREAYDAVEVGARDPFVRLHPEWLKRVDGRWNIERDGGVCACLAPKDGTWGCTVYADRPRTCRDFEMGGTNCVDARVRLGITP